MISGLRILAVMVKEFTQLARDRLTYAMILALPVVQLMLFGYAINTDPRHLPTVILMQDHSAYSRSVAAALANTGYFDVVREARSPADLDNALESGKALFAITIPEDFERRVVRGDHPQILIEADASDPIAAASAAPWRPCSPPRPRRWRSWPASSAPMCWWGSSRPWWCWP